MNIPEVVVIGGGISGLSTSYYLSEMFHEGKEAIHLTLLESGSRLGGKIITLRENESVIEGGPDSFFTQKPWALDLCNTLGLSGDMIKANSATKGTYILNHGKLSKLPEGTEIGMPTKLRPFMFTDLISLGGKFRALLDLLIPKKKTTDDESIGSFMGRRFGKQFVIEIVEPLYAGIYAGDVYNLSAKATLPGMVTMESTYGSLIRAMKKYRKNLNSGKKENVPRSSTATFVTLKGGMDELVNAIQSKLFDTKVMLNTKVLEISSVDGNSPHYKLTLENGDHLDADVIVLTVPAFEASRIIRKVNSKISSILEGIQYVSTATLSLAFSKKDVLGSAKGHGFLVPRTENEFVTGCTWESSKWQGRAPEDVLLARCYLGKFGHEEFASLNDDTVISNVLDFLRRVTGISVNPLFTKLYRWKQALPQYTVGHLDRIEMINTLLKNNPGLFLTGAAYRGVGLPDCIHDANLIAESTYRFIQERMNKAN